MSLNSVSLVGRCGNEPTLKTLKDEAKVCNVSMAVNRPTKDGTTDWIDVQFWGKSAEVANGYLKKGHLFGVVGNLKQERWQDKDGTNRSKLIVVASRVSLLETKKSAGEISNEGADFFSEEVAL
ncbi:MAG TPA: single-stranded DNA-binding protein [Candidatus Saccharimonadales bacterium]